MRIALSVLLALHGTIHLLGFVKGFGLAAVEGLKLPVGRPAAALWLLAAVGFAASAVLLHAAPRHWSIVGLPALLLSQALIVRFWSDARFGTIANLIVLVPVVLALLELLPGSFQTAYRRETLRHLAQLPSAATLVAESDLVSLPPLVQRYLHRAGVVGRPRVHGFSARFHGRFRQGLGGRRMTFTAEQHNLVDPSARLFLMRASLFGLPIDGYHDFGGVRLPARGDATWKMPEGDFVYGEFNLDEVTYFPRDASRKR